MWKKFSTLCAVLMLSGCTGIPETVEPVQEFNAQRYLGTWYEIARLDHSFERGLTHVTAEYSQRDDGGIRVLNSGTDMHTGEREQAEGKAYPVDEESVGHLKVSFFGPFYASYVIFELDENYQYAFVSGPDTDFVWLLARTPTVSDELKQRFMGRLAESGFDTDALIWVDQE
jgi:apolipoprotein D and lipocalin family protein